jgi:acetoacetyl-CoA synthetase
MSGGTDVCTAFVGGCSLKPIIKGQIQARCLGAAIYSFDENGNNLIDKEGELVIVKAMPSMPLGLWNDPSNQKYIKSYFDRFQDIWCHGDWLTVTNNGGIIITGRSDATLNRYGIRIGTAEIYRALGHVQEISDSLIIHIYINQNESKLILFVCLGEKMILDEKLINIIKQVIKTTYSPRHIPDEIYQLNEIPYTLSGKKIELPLKRLYEGEPSESIISKESLRNPSAWEKLIEAYVSWKIKKGN